MYKYIWTIVLLISCVAKENKLQNKIEENPNIILIMTDDQGWGDAGFNGNTEIKTPNLDYLASNGIIFDRFYSASAVCSPTRASLITGRNPYRMGIPTANKGHMKVEEITIAELLKDKGYATGHFGKWHLGTLTKTSKDANRGGPGNSEHFSIPTMHGYDHFFCTESKVPTYDPMIYPSQFDEGESKRYGWKAIKDKSKVEQFGTSYWKVEEEKDTINLQGDDSRIIMDRVIPFIENSTKEGKPFFTTIWIHAPHLPVVSDETHRELYSSMDLKKQIYYGTITAMDEQIGRLWDKLKEQGIDDNTMIWFCSDNGPENKTPGSAGIFRERKRSLYEGGVRVPAFVYWKNQFDKKTRMDFPAVTSDYLPTILDILKIDDYPGDRPIDGESLLPLLNGTKKKREKPIGFLYAKKMSWVNNQYKLISTNKGETFELYDLINDRGEKNNIISQHPEVAEKMKKELNNWLESVQNSENEADYD
ncbi:MAG: sulfatase-like hydrolase/transferase [Bacteroidetes bacterium]|nr:sulfatase-like hydrolase/transferase [Bacteroidota bacterium]